MKLVNDSNFKEVSTPLSQELLIDFDHVCISVDEYKRLIKADVTLVVLCGLYQSFGSFEYDKMLQAVFGSKPQREESHA